MENKWLLQPVVGEVNNLKAVVLFELADKKTSISYDISCDLIDIPINLSQFGPTRVILEFPKDGIYNVVWKEANNIIFTHTIVIKDIPDKLIFVSCDLLEADSHHSMWDVMNKELVQNQHTSIVHLGDQAYMDNVFKKSVKYCLKHGYNNTTYNTIISLFGERYYNTWRPHNKILSMTSNYNIWDDHELKNDMKLSDLLRQEYNYVRDIAINAYEVYQNSLHLNFKPTLSKYSWIKIVEDLAIIAIERTSQIVIVNEVLNLINSLQNTRRIILCFSGAPIPSPKNSPDKHKFWKKKDLIQLYSGLFEWLMNDREILVVGGDLHFGVHGIVTKDNKAFPVVIASPITNHPTQDRKVASKGMQGEHILTQDKSPIVFTTISSKPRRCYATADLNTVPITVTINYSSDKYPKDIINYGKTILSFV